MIKVICENYRGEKMTFSRTPRMWIESISGLGADYEVTTSKNSGQDGENYTGATASKRNIVMVLDVPKRRMDDVKDRLYSFFQPRSVGILYYYSGNIARKIRYYVESIEPEVLRPDRQPDRACRVGGLDRVAARNHRAV